MEILNLLIQFVQAVAWPITVLFIVIIFRKNISFLIDRIQSFKGPAGIEIQAQRMKQVQENVSRKTMGNMEGDIVFTPDPSMSYTQNIFSLQEDKGDETKSLENLSLELKTKDIQLEFERIFNVIFNVQIEFLDFLRNNKKMNWKYIKEYFEPIRMKYSVFSNWDEKKFIEYMFVHGLLEIQKEEVVMTPKGIGFLKYIDTLDYSFYKLI